MNNIPVSIGSMTTFSSIAAICDIFKESGRIKQRIAELENDARKFEAEMAAANHQVDLQAKLMEKQLESNEREFYAALELTSNVIEKRAANQAEMRAAIKIISSLMKEKENDPEFRTAMADKLLGMVDKLNQSQSQLECYHNQAIKSLAADCQPRIDSAKAMAKPIR
jgi:hypothetical protein